jgi:hypothetical protein
LTPERRRQGSIGLAVRAGRGEGAVDEVAGGLEVGVDLEEVIPFKSWRWGVSATKRAEFALKVGDRFIPDAIIKTVNSLQI